MEENEININSLIDRCKRNELTAQRELYDRYCRAMYNVCVRITGNRLDAEDALQESFIRAFKHINSFRKESSFGSWLRRLTINVCLNHIRKQKLSWIDLDFDLPANEPPVPIQLSPELVQEHLQKLPSGCKVVFILKVFEDQTHEEISARLGISLSTSKSQYIRAKKLLEHSLRNEIIL